MTTNRDNDGQMMTNEGDSNEFGVLYHVGAESPEGARPAV